MLQYACRGCERHERAADTFHEHGIGIDGVDVALLATTRE